MANVTFVTSYVTGSSAVGNSVTLNNVKTTGTNPAAVAVHFYDDTGGAAGCCGRTCSYGGNNMSTAGNANKDGLNVGGYKMFYTGTPTAGTVNVVATKASTLQPAGGLIVAILNNVDSAVPAGTISNKVGSTGAAATEASAQVVSTATGLIVDFLLQHVAASSQVNVCNNQTRRRLKHIAVAAGATLEGVLSTRTGEVSGRTHVNRVSANWLYQALPINNTAAAAGGGAKPPTLDVLGAGR